MKGKNQKRVTVLILAALLLTGCAQKETGQETGQDAGEEKRGRLSSFTATDLEDNEVSQEILADYDLTLVNVWATFCGPCLREMPSLGELAAEYQPQGVNIIGIVPDTLTSEGELDEDQVDLARDLVEETKAEYTHLLPSQDLFGLLGQIYAVPTTFFVDSEGNQVGDTYMQSMSKEELSELFESHLAQVQG